MAYDDRDVAFASRNIERRGALVASDEHVGHPISGLQAAQVEFVQEFGEQRSVETDLAPFLVEF